MVYNKSGRKDKCYPLFIEKCLVSFHIHRCFNSLLKFCLTNLCIESHEAGHCIDGSNSCGCNLHPNPVGPIRLMEDVTRHVHPPSAPPSCAALAMTTMFVTLGVILAKTGILERQYCHLGKDKKTD